MTDDTKKDASARGREKLIEVWVTDDEKERITEYAKEAGLSRSGYLRALGLNTPLRLVVDLAAVTDLAKVMVTSGGWPVFWHSGLRRGEEMARMPSM